MKTVAKKKKTTR